jgi:hypothetical protein
MSPRLNRNSAPNLQVQTAAILGLVLIKPVGPRDMENLDTRGIEHWGKLFEVSMDVDTNRVVTTGGKTFIVPVDDIHLVPQVEKCLTNLETLPMIRVASKVE